MMVRKLPHRVYTILHTESSLGWGGQERRILVEAMTMRQRGHRLLMACEPRGQLYSRAREQGFEVIPLFFGGWRNLAAIHRLRHLLWRRPVDILNTHSSLDSWVGALAWRTIRERPVLLRTRHLSTPVKDNRPTRWLYQAPAAIVTTGQFTKELLMTRLGVPARRIFSIPTGVDLSQFTPGDQDRELRRTLNIPDDAFVFGSVAVLRSWKGHLYLLEALSQLMGEGVPAYLLLVGEGPYRVVIEERIAQLGLTARVRLMGHQEQVADYFALMDVVVLASYANEGVPQSLLQALAMAKPVVGTTVGGIPEVIIGEETGLLVWPRDAETLARAMRRLMEDTLLARELGQRGRDLVVERFSLEQMAAEMEAVYEVVCRRGGREGREGEKAQPAGKRPASKPRPRDA